MDLERHNLLPTTSTITFTIHSKPTLRFALLCLSSKARPPARHAMQLSDSTLGGLQSRLPLHGSLVVQLMQLCLVGKDLRKLHGVRDGLVRAHTAEDGFSVHCVTQKYLWEATGQHNVTDVPARYLLAFAS